MQFTFTVSSFQGCVCSHEVRVYAFIYLLRQENILENCVATRD